MFEGLGYEYATNVQGLVRAFDAAPASSSGRSHGIPRRASSATTRGRTDRRSTPATTACGRRSPSIRKPASSTCRSRRRPSTNTAATVPATTCSPNRSSPVDLKTGVRKWHFQFVHHPLWDHDMSSAPLLIDTTIDGKPRKVVAVPVEAGLALRVRSHHRPADLADRGAPGAAVDDEAREDGADAAVPDQAAAYARTYLSENDLIDFTPALRAQALENLKLFRWEADAVCSADGSRVEAARRDQHRQHRRRHELAGRRASTSRPASSIRRPACQRHRRPLQTKRNSTRSAPGEQGQPHPALGSRAELRPRPDAAIRPWRGRVAWRRPGARGRRLLPRGAAPPVARALTEGLEGLPIVKPPYGVLAAIDLKNRNADVPGAARRYAGRDPQPPAAQGHEHPEDGPERQRRRADHQDLRGRGRSAGHRPPGRRAARRCARTTSRPARRSAKCACRRRSSATR